MKSWAYLPTALNQRAISIEQQLGVVDRATIPFINPNRDNHSVLFRGLADSLCRGRRKPHTRAILEPQPTSWLLWWPGLSRKMITKQAIAMEAHPNIPNLARNRMAEIYQLGRAELAAAIMECLTFAPEVIRAA
jgi:hypothetical protein